MTEQEQIKQLEKELHDLKVICIGTLSDLDDVATRLQCASKCFVGMGAIALGCADQLKALEAKFRAAVSVMQETPNVH